MRVVLSFRNGERSFGLPQSQVRARPFSIENFGFGGNGGGGLAAFGYLVLQALPGSLPHRIPAVFRLGLGTTYDAVLDPYGNARGHRFGNGFGLEVLVPLSLSHGRPPFPLQPRKFFRPEDPAGKVHEMQAM